jgi:hypothetical protein
MRVLLSLFMLALASSATGCTVKSLQSQTGQSFRELECEGRVVASERILLVDFSRPTSGLCEYRLRKQTTGLAGCRKGIDPYCESSEDKEYSEFAFSDQCNWPDSGGAFQLGGGVSVEDLPGVIGDFQAAQLVASNPQGIGWTSPMQLLASAELSNITRIEKEGRQWVVYLRRCEDEGLARSCRSISAAFGPSPTSLGDIRASWFD